MDSFVGKLYQWHRTLNKKDWGAKLISIRFRIRLWSYLYLLLESDYEHFLVIHSISLSEPLCNQTGLRSFNCTISFVFQTHICSQLVFSKKSDKFSNLIFSQNFHFFDHCSFPLRIFKGFLLIEEMDKAKSL